MNRLEFMKQLARLLDDLPREEKIEILKYYNGYFDDAGTENEAEIIAQLGSPEKVAAEVKAGMMDEFTAEEDSDGQDVAVAEKKAGPSYEGYGYKETEDTQRVSGTASTGADDTQQSKEVSATRHQKKSGWTTLVIAVLLIATFRLWFGLVAGIFGLAMGLIGLLIGLVGGVIGCIVSGVVMLVTAPLTGVLSLAVGIFLAGILLLVGSLVGLVFGKLFPGIINGIRKLVYGVKEAIGGIIDGMTGRG